MAPVPETGTTQARRPPAAPVGILLASGKGTRFDPSGVRNKLLQNLPGSHIPVLLQSARNLLEALGRIVVVLPPDHAHLAAALDSLSPASVVQVINPQAAQGMGTSIGAGVAAAASAFPDATGWVIALGDMPWIRTETIVAVARALQDTDIAVPVHSGQRGHPVGFASAHREALMALEGDEGARALLACNAILRLTTDDSGILRDIDTPADLA